MLHQESRSTNVDGERYSVQLSDSLPTRGVTKEDGIAPYRAHVSMGNLSTGVRFPLHYIQLISLFLHLALYVHASIHTSCKGNRSSPHLESPRAKVVVLPTCSSHETRGDQLANTTIIGSRQRGPVIWVLERSCFRQKNPLLLTRALSSAFPGKRGIDETTDMWNLACTGIGR